MSSRKLETVTQLPEDVIQIKQYNGRKYDYLFFSPSKNAVYQAPPLEYKKLTINSEGCFRPRTNDKTLTKISIEALKKYISDTKANTE